MSRFKISTVLENRSFLTTIAGNVNIMRDNNPSFAFSTGPRGSTGTSGGGESGGSDGGDILIITDNLSTINLTTTFTLINNYTQSGLSVSLQTPTTDILKTIKLSSGSFSTNVVTGYGTVILEGGNTVQLIYLNSQWNILTSTGLVVPVTQLGSKLVGSGGVGTSRQGTSLALSADGNTLAVGGRNDNGNIGATWIFTRSGGVWTQQGAKLVGSGGVGNGGQGTSVSLSADGNTLAVGGSGDNGNIGATWIFTRSGGVWTQQGAKLVGSGGAGTVQLQGSSISLSTDGNTLSVGGLGDNSNIGATWIFTRSGGVWTQQGAKLVGSGNVGTSQQGTSVSLSSDGNTVAIGGPTDDTATSIGAVWIFTRSGGVWTQQGAKLVGSGRVGASQQGRSVSLSADGNVLAIGADGDSGIGAVWIFTRSGGVWTQQGAKLVGSGNTGNSQQGFSVSLSDGGNVLAIGGFADNSSIGATWIFTRSDSVWAQFGNKLVGSGGVGIQRQGISVSLSGSGNIVAIGGNFDNNSIGATWIFA